MEEKAPSRKRVRYSVRAYLKAQLAELENLRELKGEEFYMARRRYLERREAEYQADKAALQRMAEAYNNAPEEERAGSFSHRFLHDHLE